MINQLKIEQINDVMNIWLDTNIDAHDFISKHYWKNHYEEVKEAISCADVFVFKEEVIKGFIGIINGDYIAGLFVLGEYQGKGIGKQLLDTCKEKYQSLALDVYVKNR